MDAHRLLSVARSGVYEAGTNLRGGVSGGGWLYALPRLSYDRVVCLGRPDSATLAALTRTGRVRIVVKPGAAGRGTSPAGAHDAAHAIVSDDLGEGSIDLLVATRTPTSTALLATALGRLGPDGVAYLEPAPRAEVTNAFGPSLPLTLTPFSGETRAIIPAADGRMFDMVDQMGLSGTVTHRRPAVRAERWLTAHGPVRALLRRGALVTGPGLGDPAAVPRYLREVAAASGRDLAGWGWAVAARGDYDSQKVLVLLASPEPGGATGVVKITRSVEYAARLTNETAVLGRLATVPIAHGRVPALWFGGSHAGRVILGESRVDAARFSERASWRADDPLFTDVQGWLTDLAAATARPVPATAVGEALLDLLDRYVRIHRPGPEEVEGLRRRFEALSQLDVPIPTVLQHGDPGIWNILADERGRAIFLDWEACEMSGMPLWDLLYFFRSYAIGASRRVGIGNRLDAATRHLMDGSPLASRLVDAVHAYAARIGLPAAAIEPLVYGCWLHRSLKEATRMTPERLGSGQFVRLLRRMLASPDAPVLAALGGRGTVNEGGQPGR